MMGRRFSLKLPTVIVHTVTMKLPEAAMSKWKSWRLFGISRVKLYDYEEMTNGGKVKITLDSLKSLKTSHIL